MAAAVPGDKSWRTHMCAMPLSFLTSGTGPIVGQGHALPTHASCARLPQLRRAIRAALCLQRNDGTAKRAFLGGGRWRRGLTLQSVGLPDDHEDNECHDQKIYHRIQKQPIVYGRGACGLCRGKCWMMGAR